MLLAMEEQLSSPASTASRKSARSRSSASASSMSTRPSASPETRRFRALPAMSLLVGETTTPRPATCPTLTAPTGPFQGTSEAAREAEAALRATTSGS